MRVKEEVQPNSKVDRSSMLVLVPENFEQSDEYSNSELSSDS